MEGGREGGRERGREGGREMDSLQEASSPSAGTQCPLLLDSPAPLPPALSSQNEFDLLSKGEN